MGAQIENAQWAKYEMELEIEASAEKTWKALTEDTNAWWLPDFQMLDPQSTVEFDLSHGGKGLIEYTKDGGFLQWYQVQFVQPQEHKLYLVGNLSHDFGGPATTNMTIQIQAKGNSCVFMLTDALFGNVSEGTLQSLESGWKMLFGDGLKQFVEK